MIESLKPTRTRPARIITPQCCVECLPNPTTDWRRERYMKLRPHLNPDLCQHESSFKIGDRHYCKLHAGKLALSMWCAGDLIERDATAKRPRVLCDHPTEDRVKGGYEGKVLPRFPLRYGSAEVEECRKCGWWRMNVHDPDKWRPGPYIEKYREDIQRAKDEE